MGQTLQPGQDVSALMDAAPSAPLQAGADVTHLMDAQPDFKQTDTTPNEVDPNTVGTFVRHWWSSVNPVQIGQLLPFPKALGGSGMDNPINPVNIVKQMQAVKQEADARWAEGDKVGATAKYIESVIPVFGPAMSHWGNQLEEGKYAAGAGDMAGFTTAMAAPQLAASAKATIPMPFSAAKNLTAEEAASNAFAQQRGVPLDAATATGSKFLRAAQKRVANSMGGEGTADALINQQQQSLAKVGGELANDARGASVTSEQAGQGIRDALRSKLQAHTDLADSAYEQMRQFEADPKYQRDVVVKSKPTQSVVDTGAVDASGQPITQTVTKEAPVTEKMGLPVDTRAAKAALRPLYEQMRRQMPVTQQEANPGLKALGNILDGPDVAPLSQVDRDLSAIKTIARDQGGLAKVGAGKLDQAVQQAAANGGPEVLRALHQGRQATIAKVGTADLIDALPGGKLEEPVAVFKRATQPGGIELLRAVQQHTPQAIPQIGRAYLEDVLRLATERGRFDHADRFYADWQKLSSETKQILFPQPGQRAALDHFFLLAKRVAENPNPSGTAHTLTALNVSGQPLTWALAKLLYKPQGVQTLTRGLTLSLAGNRTAAALQFTRAADLLKEGGLDMAMPQVAPAGADRAPGSDQR